MSNNTQRLRANNARIPVIGQLLSALNNMVNNFLSGLTDKLLENNTVGGTTGFEVSTLQRLNTDNVDLLNKLYGENETSETSGNQNSTDSN